jgi:hypothetical protein
MTDISVTIQPGCMSFYQTLELNLETAYITAVMDENNCDHKNIGINATRCIDEMVVDRLIQAILS